MNDLLHPLHAFQVLGILKLLSEGRVGLRCDLGQFLRGEDVADIAI